MTTCVICRRGPGEVKLGVKGFTSLLKVSAQRKDDLFASLGPEERSVHEHCRKSYTSSFNVLKAQKSGTDNFQPCVLRSVTSDGSEFEFKTHCIICTKKIDFEEIQKHKRRHSGVSHVEIVCSQKKSLLQETLLSICNERTDDKAADIKARIIVAGDIRAAEATYHRHCMQSFMSDHDRKRNNSSQESARDILDKTFKSWCEELPVMTEHGKQFTVQDLLDQFASHLPPDMAPYSVKHFKRKLLQQLGSGITIAEVDGRPDIVTLTHHASSILYDSYQDASETSAEQNIKTARYLGRTVKDLIKNVTSDSDKYPEPTDVNIDSLEHQIPKVLQEFMQNIFDKPRTASAILKQRILIASACHMLMQASHQSFTSPLLLSTGLFIHQTTRSRVVLNLLSSLGVSVSYDQVMDFQKAAAVSQANSNTESTSRDVTSHGFSQWVADNFDHNEDTLNGQQSTHVMGIVTCETPAQHFPVNVPRKKYSSSDVLLEGNFGNIVRPYKQSARSLLLDVKFNQMPNITVSLKKFLELDTLWLLSSVYLKSIPNWQGFMSEITSGHCICSSVTYNPMIPLNPQTSEAVYSTMKFVDSQRRQREQCCAQLTFDQPLYAKAYRIKSDNQQEFAHIQLRLGGFHQLMSYLGAGCKCMEDSGIEELWATVYACKSLPKMVDGKSYTKTLRACLLTDAALHAILIESSNASLDNEEADGMSTLSSTDMFLTDEAIRKLDTLQNQLNEGTEVSVSEETLHEIHHKLLILKEEKRKMKTGKLWLMFMDFVSNVRMFIRAERTGNWLLHLKATEEMLPLFAATGHNNYAKFCRLYLQDCQDLCQCLLGPMKKGLFTIRRNTKQFWSGIWSDMTIEQCLMRAGKTQGGLINITHKDSARTKWLLSAHVVAQYTDALRLMTGTSTEAADHHREINPGRIRQDLADMQTFITFLRSHNPFETHAQDQLRNIVTDVVAVDKVNVEDAVKIGLKIQENLTGKRFGDVVMKKADQVVTFSIMKKSVRLSDGEEIRMSSTELYQRLLAMTLVSGPPSTSVFSYELAAVSPALFNDDGSMRKCQKSTLANIILHNHHKDVAHVTEAGTVIDGCALLQQLQWPKIGNFLDLCQIYIENVKHRAWSNQPLCVVFDSYLKSTTKEPEQKRRKFMKVSCPDIVVSATTPVPQDKSSFMSNKHNKQALVDLIGNKLKEDGISVKHAADEGDADVVIVREALDMAETSAEVVVLADDTDILVLLIHHIKPSTNIFMKTKKQLVSINQCKGGLGTELCHLLPFVHAMSGCDTTSAMFGIGKVKHLKLLQKSQQLRKIVSRFGDPASSKEIVIEAGEKFVSSLYSSTDDIYRLDDLRYLFAVSTKFTSVERMPPTSSACAFHSLRVHHQVSTWIHLKTVLDKHEHGFQTVNNTITPVITDKCAAPANLLKEIRCSCSAGSQLCNNCSCFKKRIPCSIHCKCKGSCLNPSPFVRAITEE